MRKLLRCRRGATSFAFVLAAIPLIGVFGFVAQVRLSFSPRSFFLDSPFFFPDILWVDRYCLRWVCNARQQGAARWPFTSRFLSSNSR